MAKGNLEYKLRHHSNIWIKRIYYKYAYIREFLFEIVGVSIAQIIRLLPNRLAANIKSNIYLRTEMPYDYKINIDVNAVRDIRRAGFPTREPETVDWVEDCVKQGGVLYDVGANIGAVSLIYASNLLHEISLKGCVYAFEPLPFTFERLCKNIVVNHYGEVVFPYPLPLSNKIGQNIFLLNGIEAGSSGHSLSNSADIQGCKLSLPVVTVTIDYLHYELGFPSPDWLKIDVDGHDYEVLLGAEKLIANGYIRSVLIEKNEKESEIKTFLMSNGFKEITMSTSISDINLRFDR